ncbi:MAG: diguanylate cyclase [Candidatus Omnitrophica bacterium]|nr:diguanylate cyclase [Candidatus Omnitrophota bacterium]
MGVAGFPKDGKDSTLLLANADKALYEAKQKGRNKVCLA